jgi:predicted ATPase
MTPAAPICDCDRQHHTRRVVLTGGPGAGKTAVLELVRATACRHVRVLPEAASIVFGGGFPRHDGFEERRAAQRAIFHVQRELEALGEAEGAAILLCDRGTLDGLAYWPGNPGDLWAAVHSTPEAELQRYAAVIHLRTPAHSEGYNRGNPIRTETAQAAALIDARIAEVWADHPGVTTIPASGDFLVKANAALDVIRSELPGCCRQHVAQAG